MPVADDATTTAARQERRMRRQPRQRASNPNALLSESPSKDPLRVVEPGGVQGWTAFGSQTTRSHRWHQEPQLTRTLDSAGSRATASERTALAAGASANSAPPA